MNSLSDHSALSSVKLALLSRQVRDDIDGAAVLAAEPIAIIGMGCRFPGGADNPDKFWELLRSGTDATRDVPPERWDADAFYDADPFAPGKMNSRRGGFIDAIDQFDAGYFHISPREASHMDPQQRLLMEVAVEALERAGQPRERLAGSLTGVFVASSIYDYGEQLHASASDIDAYSLTGNVHCITANRLSYWLDLRGPSIAVDTACSSSLVALHLACQSLRNRDSDMAVAGGVNIVLSPHSSVALAKWGLMAPDGWCKTFDASADGFVRSEGCGVVVLKRLSDAIADNDPIAAVIRGSAVNQDGRSTAMTAPNGLAQQDVVRRALRNAQVRAEQIGCIEAHGTGTILGDPIEVEALAAVIGAPGNGALPVALTAVKTNIGHLEAAAGMAGLIKTVLCLQHEEIPPVLHFRRLNPHISLEDTRFFIPTTPHPWPSGELRRMAGISSFGFGGTNAHVVVEEAPKLPHVPSGAGPFILTVSAETPTALSAAAAGLVAHLALTPDASVGDVCATAALRRTHHVERLSVVGATRTDLIERLEMFVGGDLRPGISVGRRHGGDRRRIAFVCSGQGPQWWAMGRELLASTPVFAAVLQRCDVLLRQHVDWSLLEQFQSPESDSRLDSTEVAQPALFALQVGLAALWRSWGITPDVVLGHSVGEVAAAHLAGALTIEDAVRVIAHRGRLMQEATGNGSMASVEWPAAEVQTAISPFGDRLSVAAVNAPSATVISGENAAMADAVAALRGLGATVRPLAVNYAFHSHQMVPHARDLGAALHDLEPVTTSVRFVSTVTGSITEGTELHGDYWAANVREPVRFSAAVDAASAAGCTVFIELGPHPVLGSAIGETLVSDDSELVVVASLRRGRPELETLLGSLGQLHVGGAVVDWAAVMPGRRRVEALPTYPWQRQRHWIQQGRRALVTDATNAPSGGRDATHHPLLGRRVRSATIPGYLYESLLSSTSPSFLDDHRIGDHILAPATAFFELGVAGFTAATSCVPSRVADVELLAALMLGPDRDPVTVQVHLTGDAESMTFNVSSSTDGEAWLVHATGRVSALAHESDAVPQGSTSDGSEALQAIRLRCVQETSGDDLYADMFARDVRFGATFRSVQRVWSAAGEALGRIVAPSSVVTEANEYAFHPALLDATIHPIATLLPAGGTTYVPIALAELRLHHQPTDQMWSHVRIVGDVDGPTVAADITIMGDDGSCVAELIGLRVVGTDADAFVAFLGLIGAPADVADAPSLFQLDWDSGDDAVPASPSVLADGPWLIIEDRGGVGAALSQRLRAAQRTCTLIPAEAELTEAAVRQWLRTSEACEVVFLRGLDTQRLGDSTDDSVAGQQRGLGGALAVTQALLDASARLWLVSRGAQAVGGPATAPEQATLSGLGATITAERPQLVCVRIDLDPAHSVDECVRTLTEALGARDGALSVALRGAQRLVARLVPLAITAVGQQLPTHLVSSSSGVLDALTLAPLQRRHPAAGEVEILVEVSGLNFRDVLVALDLYPDKASTFGDECSGVVVEVGPGVEHLRVGDRVLAMGSPAFATHVTTNADLATVVPHGLNMEQAATIPIAFLTAQYALMQLGKLRAGQTVLIHAAAGGVGMAAVQIALRCGAVVLATAGNSEKRAALRALGVHHVFDSRSLAFGQGVLDATGGRGVDVVLNSLTGEFIDRSIGALAQGGRFVEIGRRDIWDHARMTDERPDVDYHVVFLGDLSVGDPPAIQALLQDLMPRFGTGELSALPCTVFDVDQVTDAFRYMAQARHTGKIVVRQHGDSVVGAISADGTYLITGGLGGIGLILARHLVERGARHLMLVGRGDMSHVAAAEVDRIRTLGAEVVTSRVDVARREDVQRVLTLVNGTMPALHGVIHAAGVTDDSSLANQTWAKFQHVLDPKLAGAWHLHELTNDLSLGMFVLMSAASPVFGSPGQANYSAANAFLDAIATVRHANGGAALSIGWGPWDQVGMTAAMDEQARTKMAQRGFRAMTVPQALAAFDLAVTANAGGHAVHVLALAGDPSRRPDRNATHHRSPMSAAPVSLLTQWAATMPAMRRGAIAVFVGAQARKILGLSSGAAIGSRQPFNELGLDSLMAVELRNAVGTALGHPQPATLLFDHPTSDSLVDHLLGLVSAQSDSPMSQAPITPVGDPMAQAEVLVTMAEMAKLAEMSEADAEALLLAELGPDGRS